MVSQLGIHDWMLKVSEKATRDRVLPPTWPKELGGFGKQFRVGLVTDVGKVNDGTFNEYRLQGHDEGR